MRALSLLWSLPPSRYSFKYREMPTRRQLCARIFIRTLIVSGGIPKMSKYLLPCLLLGALAWGQAASTKAAPNQNSGAATSPAPQAAGQQNPAAANPAPEPPKVALDAAVITI